MPIILLTIAVTAAAMPRANASRMNISAVFVLSSVVAASAACVAAANAASALPCGPAPSVSLIGFVVATAGVSSTCGNVCGADGAGGFSDTFCCGTGVVVTKGVDVLTASTVICGAGGAVSAAPSGVGAGAGAAGDGAGEAVGADDATGAAAV